MVWRNGVVEYRWPNTLFNETLGKRELMHLMCDFSVGKELIAKTQPDFRKIRSCHRMNKTERR